LVVGIDDLSAGTLKNIDSRVQFHTADIRDSEIRALLRAADTVFHLAAKSSLTDCLEHTIEAASVNMVGTLNLLEAARHAKVGKFVYADTSGELPGISQFPTPGRQNPANRRIFGEQARWRRFLRQLLRALRHESHHHALLQRVWSRPRIGG
jgi:UDP-glucose 4-epimerase